MLSLLNDEPNCELSLLSFYDSYINKCASVVVYDEATGSAAGEFISDDLKQEIISRLLNGIPKIRMKLMQTLESGEPVNVYHRKQK